MSTRSKARPPLIMPSIYDAQLKDRCKGYIFDLSAKGDQCVVVVYGKDMKSMRALKHHLTAAVRDFHANQ
jgi:hypothetical protein